MSASKYASDLIFIASVGFPWEVSEEDFVSIVALIGEAGLAPEDREALTLFFACACELAAKVDPRASDARAIHRCVTRVSNRPGFRKLTLPV